MVAQVYTKKEIICWMLIVHHLLTNEITMFNPYNAIIVNDRGVLRNYRALWETGGRPGIGIDLTVYRVRIQTGVDYASGLWVLEIMDSLVRGNTRRLAGRDCEKEMIYQWELRVRDVLGVWYPNELQVINRSEPSFGGNRVAGVRTNLDGFEDL